MTPVLTPEARRIAQGLCTLQDALHIQRQQERLAHLEMAMRWIALFADPKTRGFAQRAMNHPPEKAPCHHEKAPCHT